MLRLFFQKLLCDNRFIVRLIARTIDQSDRSFFDLAVYQPELIGVMLEFGLITLAEASPFLRIVSEPFPNRKEKETHSLLLPANC